MEIGNGSSVDVKKPTMNCDNLIVDNGVNQNSKNGDNPDNVEKGPNDDGELNIEQCHAAENGDGVVGPLQPCIEPPLANGSKSWYSRCKWRSQSCDRKQKYCPRPRYSWINGNNNSLA